MSALLTSYLHDGLVLLPRYAIWEPQSRTLYVADVHLGKAATFRALNQPVPGGTTAENLARLTKLLTQLAPRTLIFLGDLFHAPQAFTPDLMAQFAAWRGMHASVSMILVRGNHDIRAGKRSAELNIEQVDEPFYIGRLIARHHPLETRDHLAGHLILAGHVHPVIKIEGKGRDSLRLPCFLISPGQIILPAFGEFTGGAPVKLERNQIALGVVNEHMVKLTAGRV